MMSNNRLSSLEQFQKVSECNVVCVTPETLSFYILPAHPLHPAYEFLSATHRCDYLRTYFMHFYGGGYTDVKRTTGSWVPTFNALRKSKKWVAGYPELPDGVGYPPLASKYKDLVGCSAFMCKPRTRLTSEWYSGMLALLDQKLDHLKQFPAENPQDCAEKSGGKYPIAWVEMLGRIYHQVCYKYKHKLLPILPVSIFQDYR